VSQGVAPEVAAATKVELSGHAAPGNGW
jgi:hypothetical protein